MPSQLDQVAVRNGEGSLVPAGVPCTNSTRNDGVVTSARQTTSAQGPIVVADTTGTMTGLDVALPSFVLSTVLESAATSTAHTPAPTATRGAATRSSVAWLAALTSEEIDDEVQQPPSASSGTGTAGAGGTTGTADAAADATAGVPAAAGSEGTQTGSEKATDNDRRSSSSSSSKLRVLVVDDAQTVLRLVSRTLEKQGFIVDTAKNGAVALEKMIQANTMNGNSLSEKSYDVVLTDIQMPVMSK
jgi:PleD family two-component response regulator